MKNILIISGSSRPGNNTQRAAKFVMSRVEAMDECEGKMLSVENLKPGSSEFAEAAAWADGFVIASPEYNHSFPGELKSVLDFGPGDDYLHKPVVLAGVSSGGFGGTRVVQSLATVAIELGLVVSGYHMYFSKTGETFDEDGNLVATNDKITENIDRSLTDLFWLMDKLG